MTESDERKRNTQLVREFFFGYLENVGEKGDIGVASFQEVFTELMPIQREKLKAISGKSFDSLFERGSFVSMAIAYKDPFIDHIDVSNESGIDYQRWNEYAREYHRINGLLNELSREMAKRFDGIPLSATIGGIISDINHVHDYFPMVISHRTVAECAGLGWRGKNQLIIHDRFSCAIRFSSAIVSLPLIRGTRIDSKCGDCTACEEACSFIKNRSILPDYRENCRRYILHLISKGIEKDICGKCIKACYRQSIFRNGFSLSS
ncbi:MAG: hypothetical protein ACFFEF_07125 [Candidatus Thorarchaeota archaeon]